MTNQEMIILTFCAYLTKGCGSVSFKKLLDKYTKDDLFTYLKGIYSSKISEASDLILRLRNHEIGYCCIWQDIYPRSLFNSYAPPIVIFYKGDISIASEEIVSIVGTRNCSDLGRKYAKNFTKVLSQYFVIASGMAFGIDAIVNKTSADCKGKSIAVLPGSLLEPYPSGNRYVFDGILRSGGLVISEYPFNADYNAGSFISRNRIIAGLASNIILIESPSKGGSLSTCSIGFSNSCHVYAIPANIDLRSFEGNNNLIKSQIAQIITSPYDIVNSKDKLIVQTKTYSLSYDENLILDVIKINSNFDSICLSLKGKITFDKVYDIMLSLEMNGIIARNISGKYSLI